MVSPIAKSTTLIVPSVLTMICTRNRLSPVKKSELYVLLSGVTAAGFLPLPRAASEGKNDQFIY
jgi:hypothetical protein